MASESAEFTLPSRKSTPAPSISLRALSTATPASPLVESSTTSSTGRPRMPPLALISSSAIWQPVSSFLPRAAQGPVDGFSSPILTACAALAERTKGPAIWTPASANPDLTTLRRLIARGLALHNFSSLIPTASLCWSSRVSRCMIPRRPCGRSGRPGHLAAAVLDRTRNRSATNHLSHVEEIVRGRSARLGVADKEGCEQLILPGAVESGVRPERDFGWQMEILQG